MQLHNEILQRYFTISYKDLHVALAKIRVRVKFGQEIDDGYPIFFGLDNSDEPKFGLKLGSDNRNAKNVMSGFKIWTENSCPYPIFSGQTNSGIRVGQMFANATCL